MSHKERKILLMKHDRDEMLGHLPEGTTMFCLHCERTYPHGEYRSIFLDGDILQMCPYENCDGDVVMDSKEWSSIREHHPDYPETPQRGTVYPLNG